MTEDNTYRRGPFWAWLAQRPREFEAETLEKMVGDETLLSLEEMWSR